MSKKWMYFGLVAVLAACGSSIDKPSSNATEPNSSIQPNNEPDNQRTSNAANNSGGSDCAWDEFPREDGGCDEYEQYVEVRVAVIHSESESGTTRESSVRVCAFFSTGAPDAIQDPDVEEGTCEAYSLSAGDDPLAGPAWEQRLDDMGRVVVSQGDRSLELAPPSSDDNCYTAPAGTWLRELQPGDEVTIEVDGSDAIEGVYANVSIPEMVVFNAGDFAMGEPYELQWNEVSAPVTAFMSAISTGDSAVEGVVARCEFEGDGGSFPSSITALAPASPDSLGVTTTRENRDQFWGERSFALITGRSSFSRGRTAF